MTEIQASFLYSFSYAPFRRREGGHMFLENFLGGSFWWFVCRQTLLPTPFETSETFWDLWTPAAGRPFLRLFGPVLCNRCPV